MAVYLTEVVTDLAMPPQQRPIPHQFAMGDNNAYTITALLCDSRNPEAELLDGTVGGELVRPDGVTVALAGEKGDAVRQVNLAAGGLCNATPCSVTLPQACFAVPGRVTLTIKLTDGTTITQALSVSAVVVRTSTDEAVDPGEVIPDLAAIQAAAAEATAAAADARTAASSAVRYDTAQSLTAAQQAMARENIGAAGAEELDTLGVVRALNLEWVQGAIGGSGTNTSSATRIRTNTYYRMDEDTVVIYTVASGYEVLARAYTTNATSGHVGVVPNWSLWSSNGRRYVVPAGYYLRFMARKTDDSAIVPADGANVTVTLLTGGAGNLAPSDTETASNTYAAGDLMTVSGQLYKATQAIAPGDAIAAGTNVTETTVAAQLAALEARIAALEG